MVRSQINRFEGFLNIINAKLWVNEIVCFFSNISVPNGRIDLDETWNIATQFIIYIKITLGYFLSGYIRCEQRSGRMLVYLLKCLKFKTCRVTWVTSGAIKLFYHTVWKEKVLWVGSSSNVFILYTCKIIFLAFIKVWRAFLDQVNSAPKCRRMPPELAWLAGTNNFSQNTNE